MSKKADISMNMIIIAIIALIVLVVIVAIFAGKANMFGKGLSSCENKGGTCDTWQNGVCPSETHVEIWSASCENPDHVCCKPVAG